MDGQRYTFNRQRNGTDGVRKSYWTCVVPGCNARLVLHDQTVKKNPQHGHDEQRAEITVHRAKKRLKEQAATSDMSTKRMVAEAVSGLDFECRAKLGCRVGIEERNKYGARFRYVDVILYVVLARAVFHL